MRLFRRMLATLRMRATAHRLSRDPSLENYRAFARQLVRAGSPQVVLRVCSEGLAQHEGDPELSRLAGRARTIQLQTRLKALEKERRLAPTSAVWREMCEALLAMSRFHRDLEVSKEWLAASGEKEANYYIARCHEARYYYDLRAEDGQVPLTLRPEYSCE